jgi:hypothetical protein
MKKIIITLEHDGNHAECTIRMPNAIAEKIENGELRSRLENLFLDMKGVETVEVEVIEEVRHEFRRRWDDPKPS